MTEFIFSSNKELVEHLVNLGVLRTPKIIEAFLNIDRKYFVPEELQDMAYADTALPIGFGQTISQPYTVAFMLELLQAQESDIVLDVGSGSGWTTALLAYIVGKDGFVYGKELIDELVLFGQENLSKLNIKNAKISKADKDVLGDPKHAPFDRILVSAASDELPIQLVEQLKDEGTMVIPIENKICKIIKLDEIIKECFQGFTFVPLIYK